MHIEIDTLEIAFIIFLVYAVKWFFRLLVLLIISKVVNQFKRKGEEKIAQVKQSLGQFGEMYQSKQDDNE